MDGLVVDGVRRVEASSVSMASISSEGSTESSPIVEQEEIAALTHDVRLFKEALGKLKRVFTQENERPDSLRVSAHERLSEVLRVLRAVLEKYSPLQSPELLCAAGTLIQHVKGYNYESANADPKEFSEFIDQLALAFSSRVSEYLMGDIEVQVPTAVPGPVNSKTKSCENIASDAEEAGGRGVEEARPGWQQMDSILLNLERGVEYALHRAKLWSKYIKDIMMYVEKRVHAELEFTKSMVELCRTIRPSLTEEEHLPLQSLYCTALDHDLENSRSCQVTCGLLLGNQFLEPLSLRRSELERARKHLKEIWTKERKRMNEAIAGLRKARSAYVQCHRELLAAPPSEDEVEPTDSKGHAMESDAVHKALESESVYRAAVAETNDHHLKVQKVKEEILHEVRELIIKSDQTIKAVTVNYFQLQHNLISPIPIQFQALQESSKLYEPGLKYMEFVKQLPRGAVRGALKAPFAFEPHHEGATLLLERKSLGTVDVEDLGQREEEKCKPGSEMITKSWGTVMHCSLGSDTDSISSSPSSKSQDTSPTASPMLPGRKLISVSSGDELENDQDTDFIAFEPTLRQQMSKAAVTHNFRKLKTPSRCRECDTYVYFQGADCSECGLACHKKCLETLAIQCGHKRLPRKMTTFGVELGQHLKETSAQVPYIVCKCVNEIDERGKYVKGVYRVSGVKSKVEKLCQAFENGADLVDLTGIHPNVIANVLKLYLRQLPEPLLTFSLYSEFVRIAKEFPSNSDHKSKDPSAELKAVVSRLPKHHLATLSVLMQHLRRVSQLSEENKMPASNLGIVFGPTLLRPCEGSASLNSLVDTVHQTRVVELMITFAHEIFGPADAKADTHHLSRSYSSVVSCKTTRAGEGWGGVLVDAAIGATPQADKGKPLISRKDLSAESEPPGGTSDDELPDFLLLDNSFPKMPISAEAMARNTQQIVKVSLRDYQGLEGFSSTVSSTSENNGNEHRKLRKSKSDVTPATEVDLAKSKSLGAADISSCACISTNSQFARREDVILNPPLDNLPQTSSSNDAEKAEGNKSIFQNVNTANEDVVSVVGLRTESGVEKLDASEESRMRRLDTHVHKGGGRDSVSAASEFMEVKKSQSLGTSSAFLSGNQCGVIRKSSPKLSKIAINRVSAESLVDSDNSFESIESSSIESRSPRDGEDEEERKMHSRGIFFDTRHSLTDSETKQKAKPKGKEQTEESGKVTTKTVFKFDSQRVVAQSSVCKLTQGTDESSPASKERKQLGGIEAASGRICPQSSFQKRRDGIQCSIVFSKQEKSQQESQCRVISNTQRKPVEQSREKKVSVVQRRHMCFDSNEVNVAAPPDTLTVSSSHAMSEVRDSGGDGRVASGLLRSGATCKSGRVTTTTAQKSFIQKTVSVGQKAKITNLMQAPSVAKVSTPAENQRQESTLKVTQTKKGSKNE
ncbi:rho GTPase-activating protein 45-like [Ischnura elegans]|uniref:rho GTPase-activating protein 45-like n=1 Tax=Ischnura elegans TaxID=197161 RepID=UPI001ED8A151|nr:rho GTPase-activating protein 45-like [Ischnura elegans]